MIQALFTNIQASTRNITMNSPFPRSSFPVYYTETSYYPFLPVIPPPLTSLNLKFLLSFHFSFLPLFSFHLSTFFKVRSALTFDAWKNSLTIRYKSQDRNHESRIASQESQIISYISQVAKTRSNRLSHVRDHNTEAWELT